MKTAVRSLMNRIITSWTDSNSLKVVLLVLLDTIFIFSLYQCGCHSRGLIIRQTVPSSQFSPVTMMARMVTDKDFVSRRQNLQLPPDLH